MGLLLVLLVATSAAAGGVFYSFVLPKLQPQNAPPAPEPRSERRFALAPTKKTATFHVPPLPGTFGVRVALDASNAHQAWALANLGKVTDPGSLFARHGISAQLLRMEKVADRIAALRDMAAAFKARDGDASHEQAGVHFITVRGDESSWVIERLNSFLRAVDESFRAEVVGVSGVSTGEDVFLGRPEWKTDPKKAAGGVVAAVPDDDGWGVLVFWCAENGIPFNVDQAYYDPRALNVVAAESAAKAVERYVGEESVERIFLADGEDSRGWQIEQGEKASVAISGIATRTPMDTRVAVEREGVVTVASTKRYASQTPLFVVGLEQWNARHRDVVVRVLASLFAASQQIEKSDRDLEEKRVAPKSPDDVRWQAAEHVRDLFGTGSADQWYDAYDGAEVKDDDGHAVELGGAVVAGLQRNLLFFGLGGSGPDRGRVAYERFASLRTQYGASAGEAPPKWEDVFHSGYVEEVLRRYPDLARTDPALPTFELGRPERPKELTYYLSFEHRAALLSPGSDATLFDVLAEVIRAGDARFEIHGHTDSSGSPEENVELSRRRCQAVVEWLKAKLGAQFPEHVQIIPHGENELAVNDLVDGKYVSDLMAQNRRVVLKILPKTEAQT